MGESWRWKHFDRGARICRLSFRVDAIGFRNIRQGRTPGPDEYAMSTFGTIAAARIILECKHALHPVGETATRFERSVNFNERTQCQSA